MRPPDGYTLLLIPQSVTTNATLYQHLNFDFIRDIVPIAMISSLPLVMEVNLSNPAKTVPEFIAWAKANPGKVSMASGGTGSASHIGGEFFKMMTGVDMLHVPYNGGAPGDHRPDGRTGPGVFQPAAGIDRRSSKAARCARSRSPRRSARHPCRTCRPSANPSRASRSAPGRALARPRTRPPKSSPTLNKEINAALADRTIKARLAELGSEPMPMSIAEFEKRVVDETAKWAKVIREAKIPLQ